MISFTSFFDIHPCLGQDEPNLTIVSYDSNGLVQPPCHVVVREGVETSQGGILTWIMFNLLSVLFLGWHSSIKSHVVPECVGFFVFFGGEPTQRGLGLVNVQLTLVVEVFLGGCGDEKLSGNPDVHVVSNEPYILWALLSNQPIHAT